jgi:hypothetical protein
LTSSPHYFALIIANIRHDELEAWISHMQQCGLLLLRQIFHRPKYRRSMSDPKNLETTLIAKGILSKCHAKAKKVRVMLVAIKITAEPSVRAASESSEASSAATVVSAVASLAVVRWRQL